MWCVCVRRRLFPNNRLLSLLFQNLQGHSLCMCQTVILSEIDPSFAFEASFEDLRVHSARQFISAALTHTDPSALIYHVVFVVLTSHFTCNSLFPTKFPSVGTTSHHPLATLNIRSHLSGS